jgi:hypothetical protein
MLSGGHPLLAAYLTVPVVAISQLLSGSGIALAVVGAKPLNRWNVQSRWLLAGNAIVVAMGIAVMFRH